VLNVHVIILRLADKNGADSWSTKNKQHSFGPPLDDDSENLSGLGPEGLKKRHTRSSF